MSYVAPRFCADRVTPYPREGAILAQATDCSNPQHNLFHPDLVFSNAVYGMTVELEADHRSYGSLAIAHKRDEHLAHKPIDRINL